MVNLHVNKKQAKLGVPPDVIRCDIFKLLFVTSVIQFTSFFFLLTEVKKTQRSLEFGSIQSCDLFSGLTQRHNDLKWNELNLQPFTCSWSVSDITVTWREAEQTKPHRPLLLSSIQEEPLTWLPEAQNHNRDTKVPISRGKIISSILNVILISGLKYSPNWWFN